MGVTNTSSDLQVLGRSRFVDSRKMGTKVFNRLSTTDVAVFVGALR
jgi:hypothetical protein